MKKIYGNSYVSSYGKEYLKDVHNTKKYRPAESYIVFLLEESTHIKHLISINQINVTVRMIPKFD